MKPIDSSRRTLAVFGALAIAGLALPAVAGAASKTKTQGRRAGKGKGKDRNLSDAERRRREEEARLTRECQGRPNAGACLGYANTAN